MRYLLAGIVSLGLAGCGETGSDGSMTTVNLADREMAKIKTIAIKGGCFGCHDVEQNRFGPAWKKVKARYQSDEGAAEKLFESVKYGSGGRWQEAVGGNVMPPNAEKVSDAEIKAVVDYILQL